MPSEPSWLSPAELIPLDPPFEQENKRTGFLAMDVVRKANGFACDGADDVALAEAVVAVIAHAMHEPALAERLRPHVRPHG